MLDSLRSFLKWITARHADLGGSTEIRMLGGGTAGVYSALVGPNDVETLVPQLAPGPANSDPPRIGQTNVYFGLNPVGPLSNIGPEIRRAWNTARDRDIVAYSMFVVDVDPERSPKNRSANDLEKAAALEVAESVRDWFAEYSVQPMFADSGNGYHLLVPLVPRFGGDVPEAAQNAKRLLRWLDQRFSTAGARVDTSTFNPARILKLYGSLAMKGAHSEAFPHRWSSIDLSVIPNDVDLFERLEGLVDNAPTRRPPARASATWEAWRHEALQQLPIERVYGPWLTGRCSGAGWLQCRDPEAASGDQNPSAGVADGSGEAEKAAFHSFRTGTSESVFDFLVRIGQAVDFRSACAKVGELSGVPLPQTVVVPTPKIATPLARPMVDFVVNADKVEEFFVRVVEAIRPLHRIFRTERDMVFVRRGVGPITVNERNISGLLLALAELRLLREGENGLTFQRHAVLSNELARAFVASPRVLSLLPLLTQYTRSPLFDRDWRWVGQPGFHADSGIFYDGPRVEPMTSKEHLETVLGDFHWKEEADRVNFLGAMLTAITMPHWGRGHPFLAINGNKPGVGKSTLARLLGVLVDGIEPNTISYLADEAEFEKQLATRVEAGDRVLIVDNAKTQRPIESPVLERCITDTRLNFRRLGSNTAISRPQNDLLLCLTMNLVQLGADLRRRALPIHLELENQVRTTRYRVGDLVGWSIEHRQALLSELTGMVLAWVKAGQPACEDPASHSTSQPWAATIDAILRHAGFVGFLTNLEASEHAFDVRYPLMVDIAREFRSHPPMTPTEWVPLLEGILEDRFRDGRGGTRSLRAKTTIVGSLFGDYLDRRLEVEGGAVELWRDPPQGVRRSPTYGFRPVE